MLSAQPSLTPAQVKTKLQASARPFPKTGGVADAPVCPARSPTSGGCYCTTSTCGAGMLDAHAAVLSVAGVQASISLTTTTPTANQAVNLTSNSAVGAGQSIASYQWTILNAGTTGATITGANDGASVVVTPTAAGAFVIQLTTTDNSGFVSTTTLSVTVASDVVTPPASAPVATSSGRRRRGRRRLARVAARRRARARGDRAARASRRAQRGRSTRAQALKPRPVGSSFSASMRATSAASAATTR